MITNNSDDGLSLGHYLGLLRERAGVTQAEVAQRMTVSPARISRMENGDRNITREETEGFLGALGTEEAQEFTQYLDQDWHELKRPPFDHPDRKELWEAEQALQEIIAFYDDPDLKHVFKRQIEAYERQIRRYAEYLQSREYLLAMIGGIGVGKTTGICNEEGLKIRGKGSEAPEPALEVGGGGITICEVQIKRGPQYGVIVEPRTDEEIRADVADFCDYLMSKGTAAEDESDGSDNSLGISKEIVRAIRNMAKLTVRRTKGPDGKIVREDPAKELATKVSDVRELVVKTLELMELPRRDRRDIWYPENSDKPPLVWLRDVYTDLNNCRHPEFSLPRRIEVIMPAPVLGLEDFNIRIVDTKGIDQTAGRPDLEPHFDDPQTVVILCSKFNDAPDNYAQQLLRRAREAGVSDLPHKAAVVVLPRPDEARAMKEDDGTRVESDEEGYGLKREQVEMRLHTLGVDGVQIEFFNVRKDSSERLRSFLVQCIQNLRTLYKSRINELKQATRNLIVNHENEQAQAAIRDAARRLANWLANNREIGQLVAEVQAPLLLAMQQAHASTIRATVRRDGDWPNLDYYHQLGFGARRIAAAAINQKVAGFKAIAENILQDEDLSEAHDFVRQAARLLETSSDAFLKRTQIAGQSAFTTDLKSDQGFWLNCIGEWGRGPGYRDRVTDWNRQWFADPAHESPHIFVRHMIVSGWAEIASEVERLLHIDSPNTESDARAA